MFKKFLFSLLILFSFVIKSEATWTHISSTTYYNNAAAYTLSATAHTAGNLLTVCVGFNSNNTTTVSTITNTGLDTFQLATGSRNTANGNLSTECWYSSNINGSAVDVLVVTPSATRTATIIVDEWHTDSGSLHTGTSDFDTADGTVVTASGTSVTSGSFTTSQAGNLNVAFSDDILSGAGTWTAGTNYALQTNAGANFYGQTENRLNAPSGAQTASITYSIAASILPISVISFKAPSAGGTINNQSMLGVFPGQ